MVSLLIPNAISCKPINIRCIESQNPKCLSLPSFIHKFLKPTTMVVAPPPPPPKTMAAGRGRREKLGGGGGGGGGDHEEERESSGHGRMEMLRLCGYGYWVQGFRCFPWLALNYHMAQNLNLQPSTLQFVHNTGNLPTVAKPLYGILSDALYIGGAHRIPYVSIGVYRLKMPFYMA